VGYGLSDQFGQQFANCTRLEGSIWPGTLAVYQEHAVSTSFNNSSCSSGVDAKGTNALVSPKVGSFQDP
jgi:hypothetical protein